MKPHELMNALREAAPHVVFEVKWERDPAARRDIDDPTLNEDDFECWQSDVSATTIVGGRFVGGNEYLCGTWERFGDHPSKSNPDISGYLPQMLLGAAEEVASQGVDMCAALSLLRAELLIRYNEQMASK